MIDPRSVIASKFVRWRTRQEAIRSDEVFAANPRYTSGHPAMRDAEAIWLVEQQPRWARVVLETMSYEADSVVLTASATDSVTLLPMRMRWRLKLENDRVAEVDEQIEPSPE